MGKKINAVVVGGSPKTIDEATTVKDLKRQLGLTNHTATVNDQPAKDDDELPSYAYVCFAENVKGGAR